MMKRTFFICCLSCLVTGCSLFGIRNGYETPSYAVVETLSEDIEVRSYPPRLVAESIVDSRDYKEGRSAAFRLLFAYISGANKIGPAISLTSESTSIKGESREISMTSPVEVSRAAISRVRMRFFLPPEYSLGSAPEPIDPAVNVVEIPARVEAVLRFSGFAGEDVISEMTQSIFRELEGSPWYPSGKPVTYSYDPPWTLPFLRRNEISVVVGSYAE